MTSPKRNAPRTERGLGAPANQLQVPRTQKTAAHLRVPLHRSTAVRAQEAPDDRPARQAQTTGGARGTPLHRTLGRQGLNRYERPTVTACPTQLSNSRLGLEPRRSALPARNRHRSTVIGQLSSPVNRHRRSTVIVQPSSVGVAEVDHCLRVRRGLCLLGRWLLLLRPPRRAIALPSRSTRLPGCHWWSCAMLPCCHRWRCRRGGGGSRSRRRWNGLLVIPHAK